MTCRMPSHALLMLAIAAPLCAQASPLGTRPGGWETTVTTVYHNITIPEEKLARLSPEQRKLRIKAIKSHEGKAETRVSRHCVRASDTMDRLTESHPEKDGCTRKLISRTASSIEVVAHCNRPEPNKARIKVVAKSKTSVHTVIDAEYKSGMKMHKEARSRWVTSSCDDVKQLPPGVKPRHTH